MTQEKRFKQRTFHAECGRWGHRYRDVECCVCHVEAVRSSTGRQNFGCGDCVKQLESLAPDDRPLTLDRKDMPYKSYHDGRGGLHHVDQWVWDSVSMKNLVDEVDRRPKGRNPELDDIYHRNSIHCRCEQCCRERRDIIKEFAPRACENR